MTDELIYSLLAIVVFLLLSAFLSAAETSLTVASRARLHHLERRGSRNAQIVNRLRAAKEKLIGSILLGNNLVNIAASALATGLLVAAFGEAGVFYATVLMTAVVLVFGEVMPKTFALKHPDRVALAVAPAMRFFVVMFSPLAHGVHKVVDATLALVDRAPRHRLVSAVEEIRSTLALYVAEGVIPRREQAMLGAILDLSDMAVAEIMVHRRAMDMVDANLPPAAIVRQVLASRYTRLPLWRDNPENIVGVLHIKDLLRAMSGRGFVLDQLDVTAIAAPPWFVPDTTTLAEQLDAFRQRRAHFALVVDEYGVLMGLITIEDILEEIVGDIREDALRPVARLKPQADGSYLIDGTTAIRDLNRQFDWHLPEGEATTIAGLVIHEARMIPEVGQSFVFHGCKFEIVGRKRHQITLIRITPPQKEAA